MSELIQTHDNRATIRWKLLTTASAIALTGYISSIALAKADDADRPTVWIELGGQMEQMQGISSPFTAPFMTAITPTPGPYRGNIFSQKPPRFAFGLDGQISFQPENSDWIFSAGIRYGRSHSNRHAHHQTTVPSTYTFYGKTYTYPAYGSPFADTKAISEERHAILDFSAGKDFGLGMLGHDGTSTLSAGVRFAEFTSNTAVNITGRPLTNRPFLHLGPFVSFNQYMLTGHAERSFKGVGPSLSWNASAAIAGTKEDGELTLDWGINAAVLFGRQKAKTGHSTQAYHFYFFSSPKIHHLYNNGPYHGTRSRRVTVPNIGGFAGVSMNYPNVKVSIGYRYDTFIGAMDTGIDTAKKSNLTFNGPFASISIGLGD